MKIFSIIILWICILIAFACTPEAKQRRAERKIGKLVKKFPGIIHSDTTTIEKSVAIPTIKDSAMFAVKSDTAAVDSLTNHFKAKVDTITLDSLNAGFKRILRVATNIDTTIKSSKEIIHFKEKNGVIKVSTETLPTDSIKVSTEIIVNKIDPPAVTTWHERLFMYIGKETTKIIMSFLGLLLLYFIYRAAKKVLFDKD